MDRTTNLNNPDNLEELLRLFKALFKGREDVVPRFWKSKERSGYTPICSNRWKSGICQKVCDACANKIYVPLNDDLLMKHLRGQHIIGVYPLWQDNTCWFLALDFDNHDGNHDHLKDVLRLYAVCEVQEIMSYVLRSKSGSGYHIYIFFERPVPAWKARLVGLSLLKEAQVVGDDVDVSSFDKMFPGQDELAPEKPLGNLIALPFQGKAAKNGHTLFLDPSTDFQNIFPDQIRVLRDIARVNEAELDRITDFWGLVKDPVQAPKARAKKSPVKTTKPIIPVGMGKIPKGQRNNTLTSTAGSLRRRGLEYQKITEALLMENEERCNPPLPEDEVKGIARSVSQYPAGPPKEDQEVNLVSAKEAVAGLPERLKTDPGAPFEASTLQTPMVIRENGRTEWARVRKMLLAAKVSMRDLKDAMNQAKSQAAAGNNDSDDRSGLTHPYCVNDGVLSLMKRGDHGDYAVPLCNFNAWMVGEKVYDDGAEQTAVFVIQGERQNARPLPTVEVPASQFAPMGWVAKNWGAPAVLNAGQSAKDHVRSAIQLLSGEVPREAVYSHIGWKKINGVWVYLHHGGGIGPDGLVRGISVSLGDSRLKEYALPEAPAGDELRSAVRASLLFLKLVPGRIPYPGLAAIYRAPLAEILPIDFSMFLVCPSGTQKTELTAMMQAHYGAVFHGKNLPANWYGTANAMEKTAFLVKDGLLTIDDFAPTGTISEIQTMHSKADRILRGAGNRSGRQRMRADGSLRPEYYPRGLVVSSGEDIPKGHSLRGRMMVIEISPGDVNLDVLTEIQRLAADGVLAQAMSGYLQWLASRFDNLKGGLPDHHLMLRAEARKLLHGVHDRTADIVASLTVGLSQFLAFAEETGGITAEEAKKYTSEGWQALIEAGKSQARHLGSENVVNQFLRLLTAAINSGGAHLANTRDNGKPLEAESWGWRATSYGDGPLGTRIGWIEGHNIYLDPDAAFAAAQGLAQRQGTSLPITPQTLWKRLAEKGYLVSTEVGRHTVRLMVAGKRPRVIHLDKTTLGGLDELDIPLPENLQPGDRDAKSPAWTEEADRKTDVLGKTVH